jgi:hypothetical protein
MIRKLKWLAFLPLIPVTWLIELVFFGSEMCKKAICSSGWNNDFFGEPIRIVPFAYRLSVLIWLLIGVSLGVLLLKM